MTQDPYAPPKARLPTPARNATRQLQLSILLGFVAVPMLIFSVGRFRGIRTDWVFRLDFLLFMVVCSVLGALVSLPFARRWPAVGMVLSPVATLAILVALVYLMLPIFG